jgi:hypothetical protein
MRRAPLLLFFLLSLPIVSAKADKSPREISIVIGPSRDLNVTIPGIYRSELEDITATFFSRGDEAAKKKFLGLLGKSTSLTLVLTTK